MSTSIALTTDTSIKDQGLSLEERLLRMAASDNHELPDFLDDFDSYEDQEDEIIEEISETELLKYLDQQENALSVVQRLFYQHLDCQNPTIAWNSKWLSPTAVQQLYSKGWAEFEGIIGLDILGGAYQEAQTLLRENQFISAKTFRDDDPFRDTGARDDAILWFDPGNKAKQKGFVNTPANFQRLMDFISGPIHEDLSKLIHLHGRTEYQLAYYHPKKAHYERHRDALPSADLDDTTQRRITVIFYLNPGWVDGDGGEIKIFSQQDSHAVAGSLVKPLLGRTLIFMSGAIDHEVLPTNKPRFALTSWMR